MTQDDASPRQPALPRSQFVTAVAWSFIVLACLCMLGALCQAAWAPASRAGPPGRAGWALIWSARSYWPGLFLVHLSVSVLALVAAVGVLKRREWARKLFIAVLAIGLSAFASLVFAAVEGAIRFWPAWGKNFSAYVVVASAAVLMTLPISVGGCILLTWILARLTSGRYKGEFRVGGGVGTSGGQSNE